MAGKAEIYPIITSGTSSPGEMLRFAAEITLHVRFDWMVWFGVKLCGIHHEIKKRAISKTATVRKVFNHLATPMVPMSNMVLMHEL